MQALVGAAGSLRRVATWDRATLLGLLLAGLGATLVFMVHADIWRMDVAIGLLAVVGTVCMILAATHPALDAGLASEPMERLIAFVGCDGSGKSTLTDDLYRTLSPSVPVRICYLGLGSGAIGQRIAHLPLIGPALERRLSQKAKQSRTRGQKIPGLPTALVIYIFSLVRLQRFKRMLRLRRDGFVVLTDRFPQTEFPGTYDGPGLSAATAGSWAVRKLVGYERRIYSWMAKFHPDVIVRLNVDAATALARKPDHRADLIARKVEITPKLRYAGARIVDLDATRDYAEVRAEARRIVSNVVCNGRV